MVGNHHFHPFKTGGPWGSRQNLIDKKILQIINQLDLLDTSVENGNSLRGDFKWEISPVESASIYQDVKFQP